METAYQIFLKFYVKLGIKMLENVPTSFYDNFHRFDHFGQKLLKIDLFGRKWQIMEFFRIFGLLVVETLGVASVRTYLRPQSFFSETFHYFFWNFAVIIVETRKTRHHALLHFSWNPFIRICLFFVLSLVSVVEKIVVFVFWGILKNCHVDQICPKIGLKLAKMTKNGGFSLFF